MYSYLRENIKFYFLSSQISLNYIFFMFIFDKFFTRINNHENEKMDEWMGGTKVNE